jgi:hypothetical protein
MRPQQKLIIAGIFILSVFLGCSDNDDIKFTDNDIRGIFYYDDDPNKTILEATSALTLFRKSVLIDNDYTLDDLPEDFLSYFKLYQTADGSSYIKIFTESTYWLYTGRDATFGAEYWFAGVEDSDDWSDVQGDDVYKFKIHKVGTDGSQDLYVIESGLKPGYYFTHFGHGLAAKGVKLDEFAKKEDAPKFKVHRPNGNYTEGDFRLSSL